MLNGRIGVGATSGGRFELLPPEALPFGVAGLVDSGRIAISFRGRGHRPSQWPYHDRKKRKAGDIINKTTINALWIVEAKAISKTIYFDSLFRFSLLFFFDFFFFFSFLTFFFSFPVSFFLSGLDTEGGFDKSKGSARVKVNVIIAMVPATIAIILISLIIVRPASGQGFSCIDNGEMALWMMAQMLELKCCPCLA